MNCDGIFSNKQHIPIDGSEKEDASSHPGSIN